MRYIRRQGTKDGPHGDQVTPGQANHDEHVANQPTELRKNMS